MVGSPALQLQTTKNMLKIIIFDCDGVMVDSKNANRVYYNHLLEAFSCPAMTPEELEYVHMFNCDESTRYIFRNHSHIDMEEVKRFRAGVDYANFMPYIQAEPDLYTFLRQVKPNYHTAISTNRKTMDLMMDTFDLHPWFDLVVTSSDVANPKPAPDALHKILERFQATPEEAVYIGDSEVDRDHCAAVDIDLIAFKNKQLEAKYHVNNFMEILELPPFEVS